MQPRFELGPPLENEITSTSASTTTAARTPLTIHFSRAESRRRAAIASAWPGGRISTRVSLGAPCATIDPDVPGSVGDSRPPPSDPSWGPGALDRLHGARDRIVRQLGRAAGTGRAVAD